MILALLCLLALLDAALAGYRAAAGRNALIDKRPYYRAAVLRGLGGGAVCLALTGAAAGLALAAAADRAALLRDFLAAGSSLARVYVPYAAAVGLAFAIFALPIGDTRILTSVIVFGPFTLVRPWVMAAGAALGVVTAPRPETALVVGVAVATLLGQERVLARWLPGR